MQAVLASLLWKALTGFNMLKDKTKAPLTMFVHENISERSLPDKKITFLKSTNSAVLCLLKLVVKLCNNTQLRFSLFLIDKVKLRAALLGTNVAAFTALNKSRRVWKARSDPASGRLLKQWFYFTSENNQWREISAQTRPLLYTAEPDSSWAEDHWKNNIYKLIADYNKPQHD